jgi:branched-chain amino acid transport system permease protein
MIEAFSTRNLIGTQLTLGHALYAIGAVLFGVFTARELHSQSEERLKPALASMLTGALTSLLPLALVGIIHLFVIGRGGQESLFRVRDMFVNFSPTLADFLTLGAGPLAGSILLILVSAALGAVGASFVLLPSRLRFALINGSAWVLGIAVFSENVSQIIQAILGRGLVRILFSQKALNPGAALAIFVGAFLVAYFRVHVLATDNWRKMSDRSQSRGRVVLITLGIGLLLLLPWLVGLFLSQAIFLIGLYILMGLGLNIVVGFAGLLDLGYVAFFAFGAYAMGILTSTGPLGLSDLSFWAVLPICVAAGVLWGLLLGFPVLRLRGDYLAIVTLGFGEIIRILATSDWLAPIQGGPQGVLHIPNPVFFGIQFNSPQYMYYVVFAGAALAMWMTVRLRDSRLGRQWMAMREDEDVAEAMGINLISTKLLAFAIGAAFSGLAGGIFSARLGNIFPHSFNLLISINVLSLLIVGGLGSIPGVIVGAIVLVGLPELLREFTEYRLLMYGILLIVVMLVRPEGFLPEETRRRELRLGEEEPGTVIDEEALGEMRIDQD